MASGQYGSWFGNSPQVTDPSSSYGLAPNSTGPNGDTGSFGGFGGNKQIVGGSSYTPYSPQWYAAMRAQNTAASGAAGTAAGAYTANMMNTAFPSLAGITGAAAGTALGAAGGAGGLGTGATGVPAAGTMGGSAGTGSPVSGTSGSGGPVQMPDMTASNDAIFAKAKDQVGQSTRASLNSLNAELGAQGMLGGGAQSEATRDVVNSGMGQLGQTSRDLATTNAATGLDVAKTNANLNLATRGQDIQQQEAQAQLALAQRGQDFQVLNTILNSLGRTPTIGAAPGMAY